MVGLDGIKRTRLVCAVHDFNAVLIDDGDVIVFRPGVPRLRDFQRALVAFNRNVPVKLGINGAMQMRVKAIISKRCSRLGVCAAGRKAGFASQSVRFANQITRRGKRINADIENTATSAVNIVKAMVVIKRKGKAKSGRKADNRADGPVINQLFRQMHARVHEIHQRLNQQYIASRCLAIQVQHLALVQAERFFA